MARRDEGQAGDEDVVTLVGRAREAQRQLATASQELLDCAALAVGAIVCDEKKNRRLAELAVRATGMGNVEDKMAKNRRKTLGLLTDLHRVRTTGILRHDVEQGLVEIARPVGVIAALTPSTHPVACPLNHIINALKCGNALIVSPSPSAYEPASLLIDYVHAALAELDLPEALVQLLPRPVTRERNARLMALVDLVLVTGSQKNVRLALASGTPALGVGTGNAVVIVDETADVRQAAQAIAASKSFDWGTSCSSESHVIAVGAQVAEALMSALEKEGGVRLNAEQAKLLAKLWPAGRIDRVAAGRSVAELCARAGLTDKRLRKARFLIVAGASGETMDSFRGEKLSPVLAFHEAASFADACSRAGQILDHAGKGHSAGIHTHLRERAVELGLKLPVCRVIVNQPQCFANGGSFENALPFTLTLGCGTWGGNTTCDNVHYRHYLNFVRVAFPIPSRAIPEEVLFQPLVQAKAARQAFRLSGNPASARQAGLADRCSPPGVPR